MIKNHFSKFSLWGKDVRKDDLILARGFVLNEKGTLDLSIHPPVDNEYYQSYFKERKHLRTNQPILVIDINQLLKDLENCQHQWNYGMSSPNDYNSSDKAYVPVEFLDPGIALLVKVLPLLKIKTNYSCSGHLRQNPILAFKSLDDLERIQKVLVAILGEDIFRESFILNRGSGWLDITLEFKTIPEDIDSHYKAYHLALEIGSDILNPKIRKILNNIIDNRFA